MIAGVDYRIIIAAMFGVFAIIELLAGRFVYRDRTTGKDLALELTAGSVVPLLIIPVVSLGLAAVLDGLWPAGTDSLAHWPWWAMVLALLIGDDLTQYWWHRQSHTWPWLYSLHRAHHSGTYMSVRIVYRNNLLYYAFMPGLWITGVFLYLGFGPVYVIYALVKMTVIAGAHSSVPWDEPLYKWRATRPLMYVLERLISTPATHSSHHGLDPSDGATHYKGNYGNLLFLWDVIFGTAKITRRRPAEFGIEKLAPASWQQELLWPFTKSETAPQQAAPARPGDWSRAPET